MKKKAISGGTSPGVQIGSEYDVLKCEKISRQLKDMRIRKEQ